MTHEFGVGEWVADPATNELRRGEKRVRIEPRAMEVLAVLAQRPGDVVSREEILAAAWPGMVVGDEALSQSITKLRRALGDDPRAPTYIETIAKRGYRLRVPEPTLSTLSIPRSAIAFFVTTLAVFAVFAWLTYDQGESVPLPPKRPVATDWTTVTVLPFEAIGERERYLAQGIGDNLMTELGQVPGLRVIQANAPSATGYAVTGSVQRDGDMLRVNVRIVDGSGTHLWSQRYEHLFGGLLRMQDDITFKILAALPGKLKESEQRRLAQRHTKSLEAYDNFLRGQALFLARGARENTEARAYYRKALELDPQFARAYAGLALTYAMDPRLQADAAAEPSLGRAMELAESARQIDPGSAEVQWTLGFIHAQARRHDAAIAALQQAVMLNPSFADAHALLGGVYTYVGDPARSIPELRTALRFKPDGGYLVYLLLGRAYFFLRDTEQALINLREAAARNPSDVEVHLFLAATLSAAGDARAAAWEMDEVRTLQRGFSLDAWLASYPLTSGAHRERLRVLLLPLL